jgi:hypothetical protein
MIGLGGRALWSFRSRAGRSSETARTLLAKLGRAVLWAALAFVLVRGLEDVISSGPSTALRPTLRGRPAMAWPDDMARAFAVEFSTAYLTHSPTEQASTRIVKLQAFATPDLVSQLVPQVPRRAPAETVLSAAVAGVVRLDPRHALVSVAAVVTGRETAQEVLTVPITRDDRGGLAVYDLPSFGPVPKLAAADPPDADPLLTTDRGAIAGVLTAFLRSYLVGDAAGLAYLVPPGTRTNAAAGHLLLIDLTSVGTVGLASQSALTVLANVQARDPRTRTIYALRYRVRLVRRDRWYVADVNGTGKGAR